MRRILFVVNVLIAIALVAAGIGFYWVFYRALPKTSGTIETRVTQPVDSGSRSPRRPAYQSTFARRCLVCAGIYHGRRPDVPDGWAAAARGGRAGRGIRALCARIRPRIAQVADAPGRGADLRRDGGAGQIRPRSLCAGRERLYRVAPRPLRRGVHADRLRSAPLERGGFACSAACTCSARSRATGKPS